jgi:hypothetical protein
VSDFNTPHDPVSGATEIGRYVDGRPLTYDQVGGGLWIGDVAVTVDQVRGYSAAQQITWASPDSAAWFDTRFPAFNSASPAAPARRRLKTGVVVAVVLGLLFLCCTASAIVFFGAQGGDKQTTEATTEEITPKPAPEETITANEAAKKKWAPYEAAMAKYRDMGTDEFEALPRDERLKYSQYLIDTAARTDFYGEGSTDTLYSKYYAAGPNSAKMAISPVRAVVGNNGSEILESNTYALQVAYIQEVDGEDDTRPLAEAEGNPLLDVSDARKALSSVFYNVGDADIVSNRYLGIVSHQEGMTSPNSITKDTATDTSKLMNGQDGDGAAVQYKNVTYYSADAKTSYARFVYHEFTSYDGSRQASWLIDVTGDSLEELNTGAVH